MHVSTVILCRADLALQAARRGSAPCRWRRRSPAATPSARRRQASPADNAESSGHLHSPCAAPQSACWFLTSDHCAQQHTERALHRGRRSCATIWYARCDTVPDKICEPSLERTMLGFSSVPSSSTWWSDSACREIGMRALTGMDQMGQYAQSIQADAAVHVLPLVVLNSCRAPWCCPPPFNPA